MKPQTRLSLEKTEMLSDYAIAVRSRETSVVGRREVLTGKAKFGIFGDGKELPQLALAREFRPGDWRSGYYRDQTLMLALGLVTVQEFFAQLYAHADEKAEPHSAGRQMNGHFATRFINSDGSWKAISGLLNSSADLSPTGSQMPRLVGLGYASRIYRELASLHHMTDFSNQGNEVAFGMIGNASCAEGMFWESLNAIGVLRAPVVLSIWDDGYGISVPNHYQITRENLSELLKGFQRESGSDQGFDLYTVRAWDYPQLLETYHQATYTARNDHIPAIIHVIDVTQPQGHSTSGSHERYKSPERLAWEVEFDGIQRMRLWIMEQGLATESELLELEEREKKHVEDQRKAAWKAFTGEIETERDSLNGLLEALEDGSSASHSIAGERQKLMQIRQPLRRDVMASARRTLLLTRGQQHGQARQQLVMWKQDYEKVNHYRYGSHLYVETPLNVTSIPEIPPTYAQDAEEVPGFQVLNANFDAILARYPHVIAFGEDVGKLGDVNQAFAGLQEKYGELRVSDTGIRETTIIGQAIGMAMRGLRPIAEIQYLDYLLYALQILSDDLATVHWRSKGAQKAPVIVRTRGHRLEGIWHSGSLMGGAIHLLRGMHVLVPRNMTQAAGMYNTLLQTDEPALLVEVLNGYRQRERMPGNPGEFTVPIGVPEVVRQGGDVTLVTYGACVPIALEAAELLHTTTGIEIEVIDVRSLLPFDIHATIVESLKKTNRIVFLDEDVPGGASAYMMQQVLEKQGGYWHLDSEPRTLTGQPHRPAYGSDGNYFSKPGVEDVMETVYDLMSESDPRTYPAI